MQILVFYSSLIGVLREIVTVIYTKNRTYTNYKFNCLYSRWIWKCLNVRHNKKQQSITRLFHHNNGILRLQLRKRQRKTAFNLACDFCVKSDSNTFIQPVITLHDYNFMSLNWNIDRNFIKISCSLKILPAQNLSTLIT